MLMAAVRLRLPLTGHRPSLQVILNEACAAQIRPGDVVVMGSDGLWDHPFGQSFDQSISRY